MAIWLSLLISMICIQVPNLLAVNKSGEQMTLTGALMIGLYVIPTGFLANTFMAYFFGAGSSKYSYVVLTVATYAFSLIVSMGIQLFVLKNKDFIIADYLAVLFVFIGLTFMLFRTEISSFLIK